MIARRRSLTTGAAAMALAGAIALTGCAPQTEEPTPLRPAPEPSADAESSVELPTGPVEPVGEPSVLLTGLQLPWSIAFLSDETALISERDTTRVLEFAEGEDLREVGTVPGVQPGGEGGLLGLETLEEDGAAWLYAYRTTATDNSVVRMPLAGDAGARTLGEPEVIVDGIEKANIHNGGRIKFGPDGMLYITTGDASEVGLSQDSNSLNGKILRVTPDGAVPEDNPIAGSPVYSLGHRNPQGIAWDADGQLWAAEFGQDTWDEFNRIDPGANYGWPDVEGSGGDPDFVDPVYQWTPAEASPSGLAHIRDTFFLAGLRGQRAWALYPGQEGMEPVPYFQGQFGRIRDIIEAPDGAMWMLTSNTGRDTAAADDDRLIRVELAPLAED